jgi:hypothetical protein
VPLVRAGRLGSSRVFLSGDEERSHAGERWFVGVGKDAVDGHVVVALRTKHHPGEFWQSDVFLPAFDTVHQLIEKASTPASCLVLRRCHAGKTERGYAAWFFRNKI